MTDLAQEVRTDANHYAYRQVPLTIYSQRNVTTLADGAKLLGIARSTFLRWLKEERDGKSWPENVPHPIRIGRTKLYFRIEDLQKL